VRHGGASAAAPGVLSSRPDERCVEQAPRMKRAFRLERESERHEDVREEQQQNGDHDCLSRFN
jgi:hypothetical protein